MRRLRVASHRIQRSIDALEVPVVYSEGHAVLRTHFADLLETAHSIDAAVAARDDDEVERQFLLSREIASNCRNALPGNYRSALGPLGLGQ